MFQFDKLLILTEEDLFSDHYQRVCMEYLTIAREQDLIIVRNGIRYRVLKSRFGPDGATFPIGTLESWLKDNYFKRGE